jgi:hypothetical protein
LIVGLAIIVALGLVVVGATALFGTLTSKSGSPGASLSPSSAANGAFATVTVIGPSARLLAKVPTTQQILLNDTLKKGDQRFLQVPDVDLTIYDPKAVTLTLNGMPVKIDTTRAQVGFNIKNGQAVRIP